MWFYNFPGYKSTFVRCFFAGCRVKTLAIPPQNMHTSPKIKNREKKPTKSQQRFIYYHHRESADEYAMPVMFKLYFP